MTVEKDHIIGIVNAALSGDISSAKEMSRLIADSLHEDGDEDTAEKIRSIIPPVSELPIGLEPLDVKKTLDQIDLNEDVQAAIDEFLTEQREADLLLANKITPRHKVLLMGPPGNGKTVLAAALTVALGVPGYIVRYDALISKAPGETSKNILQIFNFAENNKCLLFFDEFDAIGREREDSQESGEMKRVTSTLLFQLDSVPSHVVCVAATNHPGMLDSAIWRRFNLRLELPMPSIDSFQGFIRKRFADLGYPNIRYGSNRSIKEVSLKVVAYRLAAENLSDADLYVTNCIRQFILAKGTKTIEEVIYEQLDNWNNGQKRLV